MENLCIDWEYAKSCQFNLQKLSCPIPVYNIDGSPNEAGSITEAVSLIICTRIILNGLSFASLAWVNINWYLDIPGFGNTIWRLIGPKEKSKCLDVLHIAAPGAETNSVKKGFLLGDKHVSLAWLYLSLVSTGLHLLYIVYCLLLTLSTLLSSPLYK